MSGIYEKLQREAASLAEKLRAAAAELQKLRTKIGVSRAGGCRYTRFIGVDGSLAVYTGGVLTTAVVQAAAVIIEATSRGLRVVDVEREGPYTFTMLTPYDSIEVRAAVEEAMSVYETLLLERIADRVDGETLVVIDGPLADPPRHVPLSRYTRSLVGRLLDEKGGDYHQWRASVVRLAAERGGIAGYVKRPGGVHWLADAIGVPLDDQLLAEALLQPGEYTRPRKAPESHPLSLYREHHYTYVKPAEGIVARIDSIGALGTANAADCLLLLPRARHPLPVAAAHHAAMLRVDDARRLHRLLASALVRRLGRDAIRLLSPG